MIDLSGLPKDKEGFINSLLDLKLPTTTTYKDLEDMVDDIIIIGNQIGLTFSAKDIDMFLRRKIAEISIAEKIQAIITDTHTVSTSLSVTKKVMRSFLKMEGRRATIEYYARIIKYHPRNAELYTLALQEVLYGRRSR
tara:strand:+ start:92 stop:505 length:414 start_codon:yes stop_codon:yes gene_type:complete